MLIKNALNVKQTAIDTVDMIDDAVIISVHATKGAQNRCGICGRKARHYDNGRGFRTWRTNDFGTHQAYLKAESPRVCCEKHGVVTAQVPWARHGSHFTYDFEQTVAWLSLNASRKTVSQMMRVSWNTVGPIISRIKEAIDPGPENRFDHLRRIGIDETSYKKGHKYITVVVDHDTGKAVWVCKGHGKTILAQFFKCLTKEQREMIQLVSADGAKWIKACVEEFCPNAERCVDPFHVITWAMESLDTVRREAWHDAKAPKEKRKRGRPPKGSPPYDHTASEIKGARYALGKAPEHLTENQQVKLTMVAKSDPRLYRGYLLKEKLRFLFQLEGEEMTAELDSWIKWAQHCRIPAFVELQRKIRRHYDAIIATVKYHLSNARIEAINNKIKLSIRMAYGFRNIDNLLDMIMLRCSDLTVLLPWEAK